MTAQGAETADSMLEAVAVISPARDQTGAIVDFHFEYVNDAYCALVALDRERLVGQPLGSVFPRFPNSDRFAVCCQVAQTGTPQRSEGARRREEWMGTALAPKVLDTIVVHPIDVRRFLDVITAYLDSAPR